MHKKSQLLQNSVEHIDITTFDARPIIDAMDKMSFTARDMAKAAEIFNKMLKDQKCSIILTIAGSTSAAPGRRSPCSCDPRDSRPRPGA